MALYMLGLTKKQFIKRSKEFLDAEGINSLIISELVGSESDDKTNPEESYQRIRAVMKDMNSIFTGYEQLNPPSTCISLKLKILNSLIFLQDAASALYDYYYMNINHKNPEDVKNKLEESRLYLNKFREVFRPLTQEIDLLL